MNDFQKEMDGVEPIAKSDHIPKPNGNPTDSFAKQKARENAESQQPINYLSDTLDEDNRVLPDHLFEWKADGANQAVFAKLKQGTYEVTDRLDLHGQSIKEARESVWKFIEKAIERSIRTILIIHGRGERSEPKATMKSFVGQMLQEHKDVIAFCTAPKDIHLGGTGSTLVWLRKSSSAKEETSERIASRRG